MPIPLAPLAPSSSSSSSASSAAAAAGSAVVTLQEVEREVARRTGPFERHVASSGVHTATTVFVDQLKTSMNLGGHTGLWLLRRGFTDDASENGLAIAGFLASDRQRRIKNWDQATGRIDVDSPWTNLTIANEWMEIIHLNPAQVIRVAVRTGLKRVMFEDRSIITTVGLSAERSITASLPWVTAKSQVKGVAYSPVGAIYDPSPVHWYEMFEVAGSVWITIAPDPYPNSLYIKNNRPAFTLVNGAASTTGPLADNDTLPVPLDRAASAGHIECWRSPRAAAALRAMAERGFTATQQQAADEHTRQNRRKFTRPKVRWQLSRPLWAPARTA